MARTKRNDLLAATCKLLKRDTSDYTGADISIYAQCTNNEANLVFTERKGDLKVRHEFTIPCKVIPGKQGSAIQSSDGCYDYTEGYSPDGGIAHLNTKLMSSVLHNLANDAEISLVVYLDSGTNSLLSERGLHSDHYELEVKGSYHTKEIVQRFLVGTDTVLHNSCRFGVS